MKTLFSVIAMLASNAALAHDSTVPHVHPHGFSVLPDIGALVLAALLVVATCLVIRRRRIK